MRDCIFFKIYLVNNWQPLLTSYIDWNYRMASIIHCMYLPLLVRKIKKVGWVGEVRLLLVVNRHDHHLPWKIFIINPNIYTSSKIVMVCVFFYCIPPGICLTGASSYVKPYPEWFGWLFPPLLFSIFHCEVPGRRGWCCTTPSHFGWSRSLHFRCSNFYYCHCGWLYWRPQHFHWLWIHFPPRRFLRILLLWYWNLPHGNKRFITRLGLGYYPPRLIPTGPPRLGPRRMVLLLWGKRCSLM